jgi:hypothetical protein
MRQELRFKYYVDEFEASKCKHRPITEHPLISSYASPTRASLTAQKYCSYSSVGIETGYRLGGRGTGLRFPPLNIVKTGFRALPASCPMSSHISFTVSKAAEA